MPHLLCLLAMNTKSSGVINTLEEKWTILHSFLEYSHIVIKYFTLLNTKIFYGQLLLIESVWWKPDFPRYHLCWFVADSNGLILSYWLKLEEVWNTSAIFSQLYVAVFRWSQFDKVIGHVSERKCKSGVVMREACNMIYWSENFPSLYKSDRGT